MSTPKPWRNRFFGLLVAAPILAAAPAHASATLSLNQAVELAQYNDPWLVANQQSQHAMESRAVAAGALPDPKMSVALANLPTDTFDFDQEAMTQFKVGLSQVFPRGDSRALRRKKLRLMSGQFPYQRENRLASVVVTVTGLWLDVFKAQESIALIERDRALFEQLADVAHLSYSAALGRSRQQDVVRAQLELTRLEDRLTVLQQQRDEAQQRLSEWLSDQFSEHYGIDRAPLANALSTGVDSALPQLSLLGLVQPGAVMAASAQQLAQYFFRHPSVMALDSRIKASGADIELSAQKYKPEWGVNMSYGYRDSDPAGLDRADFLSVGVTFDVPLFTANRQDREYQASIATAESVKTEKWLLLRKMIAAFEATRTRLQRLDERNNLYRELLLPQMQDQAEASLTAYTNDDGDFAEVMRANIALLNAQIDELGIAVDRQKAIAQLNYFLTVSVADNANEIEQGGRSE
jgi:outer membrane protein TolC